MKNDINKIYGDWTFYGSFNVEPSKTALIIIDMQQNFCRLDSSIRTAYSLAFKHSLSDWAQRVSSTVIPNIEKLLQLFRQENLKVVHVTTGAWSEDRSDLLPHIKEYLERLEQITKIKVNYILGTPEMEIVKELTPRSGEVILQKASGSAFTTTRIDQALRDMSVKYLILTGLSSDGCVLATAIDAYDRGYKNVLISDASTTFDVNTHEVILNLFRTNWGRVCTTSQIIQEMMNKTLV